MTLLEPGADTLAAEAAQMLLGWRAQTMRRPVGLFGPFWGYPEKPRTKRTKDAQKAARRARRKGER